MSDRDDFVLSLPSWVLRRRGARMLDPVSAPRPVKGDEVSPRTASSSAYLDGRLMVRGLPGRAAAQRREDLESVLRRRGYAVRLRPDPVDERLEGLLTESLGGGRSGLLDQLDGAYQTRMLVEPVGERPEDPDPWVLVLVARSAGLDGVDLEHLVIPGPGGAYWEGHGPGAYWEGHGPGAYWEGHGGDPGCLPGRAPVSVAVADPSAGRRPLRRPPVVVVPDTGIGSHPWFDGHDRVQVLHSILGVPVTENTTPDPERHGISEPLVGELDRLSGHGTFIAGVLRQRAPDARIVGLPLMDASGTAAEGDVSRTLVALLVGHVLAQEQGRTDFGEDGGVLDVLSLSLGFYHQDGEVASHPVRDLLQLFADRGVMVVAAAGNQATSVPLYPAGWAAAPGAAEPAPGAAPPLVSVGALNPDGDSVAMFSNAGPWVTAHRPGVNVVSTMPTTFDASARAAYRTETETGVRATPDPDDMSGGFAVWSGTSFAAPWLAGQLAQHLCAGSDSDDDVGVKALRARARRALSAELGGR
ncbi:S8 family serine peptidase [Ornithinimicrobium sp. LYQ92]|uniref:S8 family serine peptidase n=1 Tax=Serinicoccus sp. LYQ92 TaxID=3378798 RepID=UPI0038543ED2